MIPVDDIEKIYAEAPPELREHVSSILSEETSFVVVSQAESNNESGDSEVSSAMRLLLDEYKVALKVLFTAARYAWGTDMANHAIYSVVMDDSEEEGLDIDEASNN